MTLVAGGRDVLLEAEFAVELAALLHEADVLQRAAARRVHAHEVLRAPDAAQRRYKRTPTDNRRY